MLKKLKRKILLIFVLFLFINVAICKKEETKSLLKNQEKNEFFDSLKLEGKNENKENDFNEDFLENTRKNVEKFDKNKEKIKNALKNIKWQNIELNSDNFEKFGNYLEKQINLKEDNEWHEKVTLLEDKDKFKILKNFDFQAILKIREICGNIENIFSENIYFPAEAKSICLGENFVEKFDKLLNYADAKFETAKTKINNNKFKEIVEETYLYTKNIRIKLKNVFKRIITTFIKKEKNLNYTKLN